MWKEADVSYCKELTEHVWME